MSIFRISSIGTYVRVAWYKTSSQLVRILPCHKKNCEPNNIRITDSLNPDDRHSLWTFLTVVASLVKENLLPSHHKVFARQSDIFASQFLHDNQQCKNSIFTFVRKCNVIILIKFLLLLPSEDRPNTIPAMLKRKCDTGLTKQWDRRDARQDEHACLPYILFLTNRHKTQKDAGFHENQGVYFSDWPKLSRLRLTTKWLILMGWVVNSSCLMQQC